MTPQFPGLFSNEPGTSLTIGAGAGTGTGDPGSLNFQTSTKVGRGTRGQPMATRWTVSGPTPTSGNPGDLLAATDGAVNIGASGANRPDRVYVKTPMNINGTDITGGTTTTITVRDAGGTDDCNIVVSNGLIESTTCSHAP